MVREQPGFIVRSCPESGQFVVERVGTQAASNADVERFNKHHAGELITDGITAVGIGGCCRSNPPRACLVVYAEAETVGATTLLATLDRLLGEDGTPALRLPVAVHVSGPRRPRCAPTDPACGPVGYDHQCAAPGSLSPTRDPIGRVDSDPRNTCAADGDCLQSGCGNECTSYHQGNQAGTCEGSVTLESAWCGCVRGRCSWFK
jgi:hypothetical protein